MLEIGIIGAGAMGSGIAQVAAQNNHKVTLIDTTEEALAKYKQEAETLADKYSGVIDIEEHIKLELEKSNQGIQQDLADSRSYVRNEEDKLKSLQSEVYGQIDADKAAAKELTAKAIYIALYNELFINGQRDIGDGKSVEFFDRNRFYSAIGYVIKKGMKVQFGIMNQTTNTWSKNQLQFSFHHNFNI